ncbi:dipeptidase PepV [Halobacillus campisalis]|uniref:Dipeptidase PepV n=1 Tax=Halobacillus campisalis TaxID=435909 RepID=A0ABW2K1P0_9BACI|nr:dipeptidase PepV [Halobacillus campisalis]
MYIASISERYQKEYVEKLFPLLEIPSVYEKSSQFSYGKPIDDALNYILDLGEKDGFIVKNVNGHAGHIEFGQGEEIIGILGHLDVVPAGGGWETDPFKPVLKEDKIYARGVQDDKGPVMASYMAMKMLKDQGFLPKKKVRLIVGTDEERDWKGIEHYFKHEKMPEFGFSPDASFPVIHAEKGLIDAYINFPAAHEHTDYIHSFTSGDRLNMVPDEAKAVLHLSSDVSSKYNNFLKDKAVTGDFFVEGSFIHLTLNGEAAHASTPEKGLNAALYLLEFLLEAGLNKKHQAAVQQLVASFRSVTGEGIDCAIHDEPSGALTCNLGSVHWVNGKKCEAGVNIRYPVTYESDHVIGKLQLLASKEGAELIIHDHIQALYIEKEHPNVQTLLKVYNNVTGESADPLSMGGATYARSLDSGVAFGALFKDSPDFAHQKNEHVRMEDMKKAMLIYARSIYELTK